LVCVLDASVLIDLEDGGVLAKIAALPLGLVTTDAIAAEFEVSGAPALAEIGVTVEHLSAAEMVAVGELRSECPALSIEDASAFVISRKGGRTLITGDGLMRSMAEKEGLSVHGTLWLLDQMVARKVVSRRDAAMALRKMVDVGSRLPANECERRLKRWGKP
jgi:predicted nucleic acid-binding protein